MLNTLHQQQLVQLSQALFICTSKQLRTSKIWTGTHLHGCVLPVVPKLWITECIAESCKTMPISWFDVWMCSFGSDLQFTTFTTYTGLDKKTLRKIGFQVSVQCSQKCTAAILLCTNFSFDADTCVSHWYTIFKVIEMLICASEDVQSWLVEKTLFPPILSWFAEKMSHVTWLPGVKC